MSNSQKIGTVTGILAGSTGVKVEPLNFPRPATSAESAAMMEQLARIERCQSELNDAVSSLRLALAVAGYPIDIEQLLNHPLLQERVRQERMREIERQKIIEKVGMDLQNLRGQNTMRIAQWVGAERSKLKPGDILAPKDTSLKDRVLRALNLE